MRRLWLAFLALALLLGAAQGEGQMQTTELWQVTAEDGYTLTGKLDLPAGKSGGWWCSSTAPGRTPTTTPVSWTKPPPTTTSTSLPSALTAAERPFPLEYARLHAGRRAAPLYGH